MALSYAQSATLGAYSDTQQLAKELVNATVDAGTKTVSSGYQKAKKTFAGMEVNSWGVPMPIVRFAEKTSTWISRTQFSKSLSDRVCYRQRQFKTFITPIVLRSVGLAIVGGLFGQLGSLAGAVAGGIWGYEEARNNAMPEFYASEEKKQQQANAKDEDIKKLNKVYEDTLDKKDHAWRCFSHEGKLSYYRQYHNNPAIEQAADLSKK